MKTSKKLGELIEIPPEIVTLGLSGLLTGFAALQLVRAWRFLRPNSDWQSALISDHDIGLWRRTALNISHEDIISGDHNVNSLNEKPSSPKDFVPSQQQRALFQNPIRNPKSLQENTSTSDKLWISDLLGKTGTHN